ncbi:MAG: DUF1003 domain-containing protein [Chloroflexi bacterium]|nr:DUF1003 domain-containing protein [Chloroflexota bacterium]
MSAVSGELLREIELFQGLARADLDALGAALTLREFRSGQTIVSQGEAGDSMFIVAVGQVNIFLSGDTSHRVSLADLGRGEHFGELALFDDKPRSASALAVTDVVLQQLSRETFREYLANRPVAALALLASMSERLRRTNSMLAERATKNAVAEFEKQLSWSDRLADRVADINGSWAFILGLVMLSGVWALANRAGLLVTEPFDPYPFVFFNLLLAIMVGLQGPLIMMSQSRQGALDRARSTTDYNVNLKNEVNIETIVRELGEFRLEAMMRIEQIEKKMAGATSPDGPPKDDASGDDLGPAPAVLAHQIQAANGATPMRQHET